MNYKTYEFTFRERLGKHLLRIAAFALLFTGLYDLSKGYTLIYVSEFIGAFVFLFLYFLSKKNFDLAAKIGTLFITAVQTLSIFLIIDKEPVPVSVWLIAFVIGIVPILGIRWAGFIVAWLLLSSFVSFLIGGLKVYEITDFLHLSIAMVVSYLIVSAYEKTRTSLQERILKDAQTDALTGLYNRKKIYEILDSEIERNRRYNTPFSIIMIDLDNFKIINDTKGHLEGDKVLKDIAAIIRENVRKVDSVGRYGGDEFIIIAPQTNIDGARAIGEKIIEKIKLYNPELGLSASVGIAEYISGESVDSLIKRADDALYRAKSVKGKVCCV